MLHHSPCLAYGHRFLGAFTAGFLALPSVASAQLGGEELPLPTETGELTLPVRLGIYLTLLIITFILYLPVGYRILLKRNGLWPRTVYGLCIGLFLATMVLCLWPLFDTYWTRFDAGPWEAYGPRTLIVTGSIAAFVLTLLLIRSNTPNSQQHP